MTLLIKNVIFGKEIIDIFVEGGKISKIKKNLNLKAKEKIDGKGEKAVFPGFINCHTHSSMILLRGLGEGFSLKDWLEKVIWPIEEKLTEDDVYWGTKLACLEMIKSGITTFNEMYFYPQAQIEATKEMGMRGVLGLVLVDFSTKGCDRTTIEKTYPYLKKILKNISKIKLSIAPHAIYTVSRENLIWAKNFAKRENLLIHMHLSETKREVEECQRKYGKRPVEYLEKIGFLDKNCLFAHAIWLSHREIKILEKRGCSLIYNPTSNMKLGSGVFPWNKIKKTKINVCLGTDGPASNNSLNFFSEMKTGALLQKVFNFNPKIILPHDVFQMATKNGATALKINAGKIKEGKLADLFLIDLKKVESFPNEDLISSLVYSDIKSCVSDVICDGKILMREGKIEGEKKIIENAKKKVKIRLKF
jgi:5-methylthioadenosine/S-adenosylhomocysteine deaminase